jgi:hypothetical protein
MRESHLAPRFCVAPRSAGAVVTIALGSMDVDAHAVVLDRFARFACLLAIVVVALLVGIGVGLRFAGTRPAEIHYVPVPVKNTLAGLDSATRSVRAPGPISRPSIPFQHDDLVPRRTPHLAMAYSAPGRTLNSRPVRRIGPPVRQDGPSIAGQAVWHATGRDGSYGAAGPFLRRWLGPSWRGTTVSVCHERCIRVRLVDWCRCGDGRRLVDLSDEAFARLAPLGRGTIQVTISR